MQLLGRAGSCLFEPSPNPPLHFFQINADTVNPNAPHQSTHDAAGNETIHAAATPAATEREQGRGTGEQEKDSYLAAILAAREAELNQDEQEPKREAIRERPRKRGRSL
jgi:hypothetical protein